MSNQQTHRVHWAFWIIALVALLWNGMGAMNFFMQMSPEMLANYPESHKALIAKATWWAMLGFAMSVFGGVIGALLMFFRSKLAVIFFAISLVGSLIALVHALMSGVEFSLSDRILTQYLMVLVPLLFLVYAFYTNGKGWLR